MNLIESYVVSEEDKRVISNVTCLALMTCRYAEPAVYDVMLTISEDFVVCHIGIQGVASDRTFQSSNKEGNFLRPDIYETLSRLCSDVNQKTGCVVTRINLNASMSVASESPLRFGIKVSNIKLYEGVV